MEKNAAGCGILLFLGITCLCCGGCGIGFMNGGFNYSEGHREGTIQKFSHKGYIWKTYEGELATAGFRRVGTENPTLSNVFEFTVSDSEVVKQIEAIHADEQVRLYYKQLKCVPPWSGATEYFVYKVEKIEE